MVMSVKLVSKFLMRSSKFSWECSCRFCSACVAIAMVGDGISRSMALLKLTQIACSGMRSVLGSRKRSVLGRRLNIVAVVPSNKTRIF